MSPFGYLSVSSVHTPVADFASDEDDFGMPFQHSFEDDEDRRMQGDDGSRAVGRVFIGLVNTDSVPVPRCTPIPTTHDTDMRNQHEAMSPQLSEIPAPVYYDSTIPDRLDTPIHDRPNTPFPDRLDTPIPNHLDMPTPDRPYIVDISDEPHDSCLFLPSDSDGDNAIPTKVTRAAKPHPKAVVPSEPVSRLSDELSSGEDDEGLKGGPFSVNEVEKIKAEYAAFDKRIAVVAKEMGRSVSSIQRIGGRVSRVVNPRKTTAWNAFQSAYPANTDESVSQADYTKNMVRPAYNELVEQHGGERSAEWAAESARMIMEHTETKATISADIAKHGGEVAKVIASHKKAWQKDFKVLAGLGVHCELTVLADNACSAAAHAQNGQLFGTGEMESYYKSRRDFQSHVGDAYAFVLSAKAGIRKLEEHKAQVSRWEREEAFKNPNKAKGKVSKMLIELFGEFVLRLRFSIIPMLTPCLIEPFVRWNTFPWLKLPQKLLSHNLKIDGVLPLSRFRLLGSLSIDLYNVSEIQALYDALEYGRIKVSERIRGESDAGEDVLITDSDGRVLMTVATAVAMVEAKKKQGVHLAAERAVARVQAVDKGVDGGIGEELGGDYVKDGGGGPKLGHAMSVDPGVGVTRRSRKRPRTRGGDTNGPRKRSQLKSAEFIEDLDETTTAGPSLQMQGISSNSNIMPLYPRLSVDSGTAVGTPFESAAAAPLPGASNVVFSPTFPPLAPVLPTPPNAPEPFPMLDETRLQNWDAVSFPTLDPLLFQGPDFEELVEQYRAANSSFGLGA